MIQLPEEFDSIFRYIVVVSQRAEQLINGAKPRTESRHSKPTLVAKNDVDRGEVQWRVLTQAELDARRQEIVDQLRAEVAGAEGEMDAGAPIPDVLPTAAGAAEIEEPMGDASERDDELARLQRLLGMAAGEPEGDEDEADAADAEDEDENEVEATEVDLSEVEALEKKLEDDEDDED